MCNESMVITSRHLATFSWLLPICFLMVTACATEPSTPGIDNGGEAVERKYQEALRGGYSGTRNQWMAIKICPYSAQIQNFLSHIPPPELSLQDNFSCILSDSHDGVLSIKQRPSTSTIDFSLQDNRAQPPIKISEKMNSLFATSCGLVAGCIHIDEK